MLQPGIGDLRALQDKALKFPRVTKGCKSIVRDLRASKIERP